MTHASRQKGWLVRAWHCHSVAAAAAAGVATPLLISDGSRQRRMKR